MAKLRSDNPVRIAKEAEQTEAAFVREIKTRCIELGADEHRIPAYLAEKINVCESSGRNYMKDPGKIQMGTMRMVVKNLSLDIETVLRFMGYSEKEIRSFAQKVVTQ